MATSTLEISPRDAMQGLTLSIRITGAFRARMWLAAQIIRLAGLVASCDTEVMVIDEDKGVTRL